MAAAALTDRCHQRARCLQIGGVHIWGDEEPQCHPGRREMLGFVPHPNLHGLTAPRNSAMCCPISRRSSAASNASSFRGRFRTRARIISMTRWSSLRLSNPRAPGCTHGQKIERLADRASQMPGWPAAWALETGGEDMQVPVEKMGMQGSRWIQ